MNVGSDQGGLLLHPSCPRWKESTLGWRYSQKEEWSRDVWVFRKRSDFGNGEERWNDASRRCSVGTSCRLSSGGSDEMGHISWFWCRSEPDHYAKVCFIWMSCSSFIFSILKWTVNKQLFFSHCRGIIIKPIISTCTVGTSVRIVKSFFQFLRISLRVCLFGRMWPGHRNFSLLIGFFTQSYLFDKKIS